MAEGRRGEGRGGEGDYTKGKHFSVPPGRRVLKSTESALHCVYSKGV